MPRVAGVGAAAAATAAAAEDPTAASRCIRAGLQSAFRMLLPPEMEQAREFVLNPDPAVDVEILSDEHRLSSSSVLRVRRVEDGESLDLFFLLVPTVNLGAHQLGLVVSDRSITFAPGGGGQPVTTVAPRRVRGFAVGRYIREESTGEVLFVSNELDVVDGREKVTVVWAGAFKGHDRSHRSYATISADAELFGAGRIVESVAFAEISTRKAISTCDVCAGSPRAAWSDGDDPPMRCRAHLQPVLPVHALDFQHAFSNLSVHSGVTAGRMVRVRAPNGGFGVMHAPVVGSSTLLTVGVSTNAGKTASLVSVAMQARMGRLAPGSWTLPGAQNFADQLCVDEWRATKTTFGSGAVCEIGASRARVGTAKDDLEADSRTVTESVTAAELLDPDMRLGRSPAMQPASLREVGVPGPDVRSVDCAAIAPSEFSDTVTTLSMPSNGDGALPSGADVGPAGTSSVRAISPRVRGLHRRQGQAAACPGDRPSAVEVNPLPLEDLEPSNQLPSLPLHVPSPVPLSSIETPTLLSSAQPISGATSSAASVPLAESFPPSVTVPSDPPSSIDGEPPAAVGVGVDLHELGDIQRDAQFAVLSSSVPPPSVQLSPTQAPPIMSPALPTATPLSSTTAVISAESLLASAAARAPPPASRQPSTTRAAPIVIDGMAMTMTPLGVLKPVPQRRTRGEGLPDGTPEERRKESNRRSAARAGLRKRAYFEGLCRTLEEAKANAVRLLREERVLKDENLLLRKALQERRLLL